MKKGRAKQQEELDQIFSGKDLTWDELRERLIKAGWTTYEADEEIKEMQDDEESGMQ